MIDKMYDNQNDTCDYWKLIINGQDAQVGIDSYIVNSGDIIEFDYTMYIPATHQTTILKSKHDFYMTK